MPQNIPIQQLPNQSLSVTVSGVSYAITLKTMKGFTACFIAINGADVIDGSRVPAGQPLLPYKYEENGNFIFSNASSFRLPYYTNFNVTQYLLYYSPDELTAMRALTPPVFNPLGADPLRYKPQGYTTA